MFEAKIILDSVCDGQRLTTMQLTHPRIIHSEFNTHCMFARNASSSRAIPFKKMVQAVKDDPFIPEHWGINQSGMQAMEELQDKPREEAIKLWLQARDYSVSIAETMASTQCFTCSGEGKYSLGITSSEEFSCEACEGTGKGGLNVHKQIVNRLLEPWAWITVCVTGDAGAWSNYFALRCHPDAQPDIQKQAYMAQKAYYESTPQKLERGQWHTPYIKPEERQLIADWVLEANPLMTYHLDDIFSTPSIKARLIEISTGRCARTSYLTQEGTRDFVEDVKLHDRLRFHKPLHASPFEHVCQAMGDTQRYAKYKGWKSYRHMLTDEYVTDFQPNHPDFRVEV